jgi:hypothetical protein
MLFHHRGTKQIGVEVQPVADALLFLSERMLNLVEAL